MEQSTPRTRSFAPVAAGVVAGLLGAALWMGLYAAGRQAWLPAILGLAAGPLIGVLVGLAMRYAGARGGRDRWVAAACAAGGGMIGFVLTDLFLVLWVAPYVPTLADAVQRFFGDIQAWILIALGAWIAHALATRSPA